MLKLDFKKETPALYKPSSKTFSIVEVPAMSFLMVDGQGNPNTTESYKDAIAALYPLAYKLKFSSKMGLGRDYVVPPLEGLWWADDMSAFTERRLDEWCWTLMIRLPGWIDQSRFETMRSTVAAGKSLPAIDAVRMETFCEGRSVQILHIGPYDKEGPILQKMHHDFIPNNELQMSGKHHEIYLSDPRRTVPNKLKTILRQPVEPLTEKAGSNDPALPSTVSARTAA